MSSKAFLVGSFAALSIMFAGAVAAQHNIQIHIYGEDTPDTRGVPNPESVPAKQRRTESMLEEQERQARKEYPKPRITDPTPDMKKQERTQKRIEELEAQASEEPR